MADPLNSQINFVTAQERARLLGIEHITANGITDAQRLAWRQTVRPAVDKLLAEMDAAAAAGRELGPSWLYQYDRLSNLQDALNSGATTFADQAAQSVGLAQAHAADLGNAAGMANLEATVPSGVSWAFQTPPAVLDEAASVLDPLSPTGALFSTFGADAAAQGKATLLTGMALGQAPAVIGKQLAADFNIPLQRALTISRTTILRTWNGAQLANYRANADVVSGWRWSAAAGCCGACAAMDGSEHGLDEDIDDHICGRCAKIPTTFSWSEILGRAGIDASNIAETSAESWAFPTLGERFAQMSQAEQAAIVGPAKAAAIQAGDLSLSDLVGIHHDPVWGDSIYEKSLSDLGMDANKYLAMARSAEMEATTLATDAEAGLVTRTGTLLDGRTWSVRDYLGTTPPPVEETSVNAGLGSDAGEHYTPKWEYNATGDYWQDVNPRWEAEAADANMQCLTCDRIYDGARVGEFPDHMVGDASHGICPDCTDAAVRDAVRQLFVMRNPELTADEIEGMVATHFGDAAKDVERFSTLPPDTRAALDRISSDQLNAASDAARAGAASDLRGIYRETIDGNDYFVKEMRATRVAGYEPVAATAAADEAAKVLGMGDLVVPARVLTSAKVTFAVSPWLEGTALRDMSYDEMMRVLATMPAEDAQRLSLFEYLIGDNDRGSSNYLLMSDGSVKAIDFEGAFAREMRGFENNLLTVAHPDDYFVVPLDKRVVNEMLAGAPKVREAAKDAGISRQALKSFDVRVAKLEAAAKMDAPRVYDLLDEQFKVYADAALRAATEEERFSALSAGVAAEADAVRIADALTLRTADTLGQETADEWAAALGEHGGLQGPIASRDEVLAWEVQAASRDVSSALSDQLDIGVNLDEVHPAAANQFAQTLQVLHADWPEVFQEMLDYVGQTGRDWSARFPESLLGSSRSALAASNGPGIGFNQLFWSVERTDLADLTALIQDRVEQGWFYDGYGSPGAVMAHEFGHSVQAWAEGHESAEVGRLVDEYVARWSEQDVAFSLQAAADPHELFADAFSATLFGSPDVLADPMVQDMQRLLGDIRSVLRDAPEMPVSAVVRDAPGAELRSALQPTLTRDALADKNMAELRQMARDLDVPAARTKAETIDRILAKDAESRALPAVAAHDAEAVANEPLAAARARVDDRMVQREQLYEQQHDLLEERANLENLQKDRGFLVERAELDAKRDLYRATLDPNDPGVKAYLKARDAWLKHETAEATAKAEQDRLERLMDRLSIQGKQDSTEFTRAKADYDKAIAAHQKALDPVTRQRLWAKYYESAAAAGSYEHDSILGFEDMLRRKGITFKPEDIAAHPSVVAAREQVANASTRLTDIKAQLAALEKPIKAINAEINRGLADLRDLAATLGDEARAADTMRPFSGVLDLPEGKQPPNALMNKMDYRMHEPRALTKARIIDDIATRLKDDPAWAAYVDRMPIPDNLGIYHQYVHVMADARDSKSAKLTADLIRRWGVGYRPGSPQWVAMQMAARDEFGLDAAIHGMSAKELAAGEAAYAENGDALRAFMRAMHDNTQQWFADQGITEIEVYRGFAWEGRIRDYDRFGNAKMTANPDVPQGINWGSLEQQNHGVADIELNPFQSFSADINISQGTTQVGGFGGGFAQGKDYNLLVGARVPVDRVLSTAQTGFGAKLESEIVVMGRMTDTVAYRAGTRVEEALLQQAAEQITDGGGLLYSLADGTSVQVAANADGTFTLSYLGGPQAKLGTLKRGASKTYKNAKGLNKAIKAMRIANTYAP